MSVAFGIPGESSSAPQSVLSPLLWGIGQTPHGKGCPIANILDAPGRRIGHFEMEDFDDFPKVTGAGAAGIVKGWNFYADTGGGVSDAGIANRSAALLASDAADEAVVLSKMLQAIRITNGSGRPVYFEMEFKLTSVATAKFGLFFGLFEILQPAVTSHLSASSVLPDKNYIGFYKDEATTPAALDFVYKADGQTQQKDAGILTMVADTWYKAGFAFDGQHTLYVFLNGQEYTASRRTTSSLTAVTFPSDINLGPAIAITMAGTGSPGVIIDWTAFAWVWGVAADGLL